MNWLSYIAAKLQELLAGTGSIPVSLSSAAATASGLATQATLAILEGYYAASALLRGSIPYHQNPLPVAGYVAKASAGIVTTAFGDNGTGAAAYLQVHNVANVANISPANPCTTLVTTTSASVSNGAAGSPTIPNSGFYCGTGVCVVWSTAKYTYAAPVSGTNTGAAVIGVR